MDENRFYRLVMAVGVSIYLLWLVALVINLLTVFL